jgi:histidyl-tRNA synthetase
LDEESRSRLYQNPLRILDHKNPALREVIQNAPVLLDELDAASQARFNQVKNLLDNLAIPYVINPKLVRGLDYYCHTVFEWVTDDLGAQSAVCAGGRYDSLVQALGGQPTPAVGFALGLERAVLLLQNSVSLGFTLNIYAILLEEVGQQVGLTVVQNLRTRCPALTIEVGTIGQLKNQLKKADKQGAEYALIVGEAECLTQQYVLRNLREGTQAAYSLEELIAYFKGKPA